MFRRVSLISISHLLEVTAVCKSVLMREYYDQRFLTSDFTREYELQKVIKSFIKICCQWNESRIEVN